MKWPVKFEQAHNSHVSLSEMNKPWQTLLGQLPHAPLVPFRFAKNILVPSPLLTGAPDIRVMNIFGTHLNVTFKYLDINFISACLISKSDIELLTLIITRADWNRYLWMKRYFSFVQWPISIYSSNINSVPTWLVTYIEILCKSIVLG